MNYKQKTKDSSHKWYTDLTDTPYNGGLHSQEAFKNGVTMLEEASNAFHSPEMCHIVFTNGEVRSYKKVIRRFCRLLTANGWSYMYRGCVEKDSGKGLHCHLMLVLDHTPNKHPMGAISWKGPSLLSNAVDYFYDLKNVTFNVVKPTSFSTAHHTKRILKTDYERFDDCAEWLSYIYKMRSKEKNPSYRIYMSSR